MRRLVLVFTLGCVVGACGPSSASSSSSAPSSAALPVGTFYDLPAQDTQAFNACMQQPGSAHRLGVSVDGDVSTQASLCFEIASITNVYQVSPADEHVQQAAVAQYVLDSVLHSEAANDGISVSDAQARQYLQTVVNAYNDASSGAAVQGICLPPGQTAEQYFLSPEMVARTKAAMTTAQEREHVVGSSKQPLQTAVAWLASRLPRHRVVILNGDPFDIPGALTWFSQQQPRPLGAPVPVTCPAATPSP